MDTAELQKCAAAFARARAWEQFHDPKNLVMGLASEVGELAGLLRWVSSTESDNVLNDERLRTAMLDEIGDVGILLLSLCSRIGVNLDEAILRKLAINEEKYPVEQSMGRAEVPSPSKKS